MGLILTLIFCSSLFLALGFCPPNYPSDILDYSCTTLFGLTAIDLLPLIALVV